MPHYPPNETVVVDVAGGRCVVVTDVAGHLQVLRSAGFEQRANQWVRTIPDDADRKELVSMLIGLDALFSAGRDWSPEALVAHYRDIGAVATGYRSISWQGPTQYRIVAHSYAFPARRTTP